MSVVCNKFVSFLNFEDCLTARLSAKFGFGVAEKADTLFDVFHVRVLYQL